MNSLQLPVIHRPSGPGQRARRTYDYVIDGVSLADATGVANGNLVGRIDASGVLEPNAWTDFEARKLLLEKEPDFQGRYALFVSPECGDLGCGGITAAITADPISVTWSDFRYENTYDAEMTEFLPGIGPFQFDREDYCRIFSRFLIKFAACTTKD